MIADTRAETQKLPEAQHKLSTCHIFMQAERGEGQAPSEHVH